MEVSIGTCSLCGGNVMAHQGVWHGVTPPPPPHCVSCGAVRQSDARVIPMVPRPYQGSDGYHTDYRYPGELASWRSNMPPPRQSFPSIRVREMLDSVPQSTISAIQVGQLKALADQGLI